MFKVTGKGKPKQVITQETKINASAGEKSTIPVVYDVPEKKEEKKDK